MAFGITETGFNRKRLEDIRAEIRADLESVFGAGLNDSSDSAIAQIIDTFAGQLSVTWEGLEGVYQAFDPDSAEGVALENLLALLRLERQDPQPSTGTITISGTPGTVVPEGFQARASGTDVNVETTDSATVEPGGSVTVAARTVLTGPILVEAGDVDTAVDFVDGVDSVTNASDFNLGSAEETDQEARVRREQSLQGSGSAVDRAVRARLLELDFIDQALVISNRSAAVDANGFPPHSMNPVLWPATADADERQAIVDVLVRHAPGGIQVNGAIEYEVTDDLGYTDPDPYGFSFATQQDVFLDAVITTDPDRYPADGDDQVKSALATAGNALSVGDDVVLIDLICAVIRGDDVLEIDRVPGILTFELRALVGSAPGPGDTSNITIDVDEIARFTTGNITVS